MILETLVPALLPAVADGVRGVFSKFTGGAGAQPANMEERIEYERVGIERLKALAQLDNAQGASTWVINVRAMQRPVACGLIITAYVSAVAFVKSEAVIADLHQYASMVTFYLFGDRTYSAFTGRKK